MTGGVPTPARPTAPRKAAIRGPGLLSTIALLALGAACGKPVDAGRRSESAPASIVIVTLDTTRADHLTPYGYFRDTTPWLAAFAREAVLFERFLVPMATTLPTHTSIMTGTHPLEHGVLGNLKHTGHLFQPSDELRSFAEVCSAAGYATGGFVSAVPLKRGTGIEAGFERFDEPEGPQRSASETNARVFEWLDEVAGRPFLLWVHYFDAHYPFEPPDGYADAFARDEGLERWIAERRITPSIERKPGEVDDAWAVHDLYDGEIAYVDDQLAALFARLAEQPGFEDAGIVIVGDHGEALNQHGKIGHGGTFDEELHAPFLLRAPGLAPRRVPYPVTAADVVPTLLGRMRAPELAGFLDQVSGFDVLADGFWPSPIASQDSGRLIAHGAPIYRYAWTGEPWKLLRIESQAEEGVQVEHHLFDLEADPYELDNVAAREPELVARLAAELDAALQELDERGRALAGAEHARQGEALGADRLDDLRELGYAGEDPEED